VVTCGAEHDPVPVVAAGSGVRFVPVHGTERRSVGCQRAAPAMNVATM
jgi:hypothetical protein